MQRLSLWSRRLFSTRWIVQTTYTDPKSIWKRGIYSKFVYGTVPATANNNVLLSKAYTRAFPSGRYSTWSASTTEDANTEQLDSLPIREETKSLLQAAGITHLFPVQQKCWNPIWQGKDIVVRSQTGTGKTLAYALPLMEKVHSGHLKMHPETEGSPVILVLVPTRELAKQVYEEFGKLDTKLSGACIYGGAPYRPQEEQLRHHVSYLVGTPGRVADMMRRNLLLLDLVQCVVLDEADRMLEIGFASELEQILSAVSVDRQTLLFSATLPAWVKQQSTENMKQPIFIDLVGDNRESKIPKGVKHYAIAVPPYAKEAVVGDILTVYGGEKCIVFTHTKREADLLGSSEYIRDEATVIHGDIPQEGRELAIHGFRKGKFRNLIATDVAARGIDIPNVDFVLMTYTPNPTPESIDMYVHRSGRTGRAGKNGKSMLIYSQEEKDKLVKLERALGIRFERLQPPSTEQLLAASLERSWNKILSTPEALISQVSPLINDKISNMPGEKDSPRGLSPTRNLFHMLSDETDSEKRLQLLLAAAMARLGGFHSTLQHRSLLTGKHGFVTFHMEDKRPEGKRRGFGFHFLRRILSESFSEWIEDGEEISKIVVYPSGMEALFDVSEKIASSLMQHGLAGKSAFQVKPVNQLTEEMIQAMEAAESRKSSSTVSKTKHSDTSKRYRNH
jgi:ATP-dependent RNA helicase DDX21